MRSNETSTRLLELWRDDALSQEDDNELRSLLATESGRQSIRKLRDMDALLFESLQAPTNEDFLRAFYVRRTAKQNEEQIVVAVRAAVKKRHYRFYAKALPFAAVAVAVVLFFSLRKAPPSGTATHSLVEPEAPVGATASAPNVWRHADGSTIVAGAGADVDFPGFQNASLVRLNAGSLFVNLRDGRSMQIETPDARFQADGGTFDVTVETGPAFASITKIYPRTSPLVVQALAEPKSQHVDADAMLELRGGQFVSVASNRAANKGSPPFRAQGRSLAGHDQPQIPASEALTGAAIPWQIGTAKGLGKWTTSDSVVSQVEPLTARWGDVPNASAELQIGVQKFPDLVREGLSVTVLVDPPAAASAEATLGILVHLRTPHVIGCHLVNIQNIAVVRLEALTNKANPQEPFDDWSSFPWQPLPVSKTGRYHLRIAVDPSATGSGRVTCDAWPQDSPATQRGWGAEEYLQIDGPVKDVSLRAYQSTGDFRDIEIMGSIGLK